MLSAIIKDMELSKFSISDIVKSGKSDLLHGIYINTSLNRNYSEQKEAVQRLIDESDTNADYFVMLVLSTFITTLGLLIDNTTIVIGGMLITPLLSSLLAFGLGFVTFNMKSVLRSAWAIFRSVVFVLFLSFLTATFVGVEDVTNSEITSRVFPNWPYVHIALFSGVAATYAWAKPKLSATLPGVAVAVALLPPLCVVGIGLAEGQVGIITGAFDMFIVNFTGIIVSSVFVFSVLGFQRMKKVEEKEIENKEDSSSTK